MTQITRILFITEHRDTETQSFNLFLTFLTTEYTELHRVLFKFPFVIQTTEGRKDDNKCIMVRSGVVPRCSCVSEGFARSE